MLTTELFIAIISLFITFFALGYAVGSKSSDKKYGKKITA